MGIREEGAIDKDENSSKRRNDVMQKKGQQSENRLLKCEWKTQKTGAAEGWRGICDWKFLGSGE